LRLIAIPLTTYVLGPKEYGFFALMMGVVSVFTVVASSVTGYILNHHVTPGQIAPARLIGTTALIEICIGSVLVIVGFLIWPRFAGWMGLHGDVSSLGFLFLLLSVPAGAFWSAGSIMIIFDERAVLYSVIMVAQGMVQLAVTLISLYILGWKVGSLVAGQCAGVLTAAAGGYLGLRRHMTPGFCRATLREVLGLMPWAIASNIANSSTDLLERVVLGKVAGPVALGLYVHSQSYRSMLTSGGKAFSQVLYPDMLREAKSGSRDFTETRKGWDVAFAGITVIGLFFVFLGQEMIGLLTHGKFVGAAVFVPFWCIFLLLQYTGRAQVAMLYAHGQGKKISSALLVSNIVSGILMIALGLPYGAVGLVIAVLSGEVVNRVLLQYWTYRLWSVPFQDGYAIAGTIAILLSAAAMHATHLSSIARGLLFVLFAVLIAIAAGPRTIQFMIAKVPSDVR
jgi:lipopolysaccharide exporter